MNVTVKKMSENRLLEAKRRFHRFVQNGCKILSGKDGAGGAMDIAIELAIGVIIAVLILTALKSLFNVDILPQVTSRITGMFS